MQGKYPYQNLSLLDLDREIWLPIIGYEEYYMVSNWGRIKWLPRWVHYIDGRKRFRDEKILRQYKAQSQNSKTLFVHLHVEKVRRRMIVSRIVYSAFIKPLTSIRNEYVYVLHKDSDPYNNKVGNLYLASAADLARRNIEMGYNKVIINTSEIRDKLTEQKRKPVSQFSLTKEFIRSYPSIREASRKTGVDNKAIINTVKGKQKQAGGFIWNYILSLEDK